MSQRCQSGHILSSGAASVAMKSLVLKFPFKGLLQKTLFFPNSPLHQRQLLSRLQQEQHSARWDQCSAGRDQRSMGWAPGQQKALCIDEPNTCHGIQKPTGTMLRHLRWCQEEVQWKSLRGLLQPGVYR